MARAHSDFSTSDEMLDNMIFDDLDLLHFPINNLDDSELSKETIFPHEIFTNKTLELNKEK